MVIDAARRTARAGAAVTLDELDRAAGRKASGSRPDPSSSRWATLGGMISTNAAGARTGALWQRPALGRRRRAGHRRRRSPAPGRGGRAAGSGRHRALPVGTPLPHSSPPATGIRAAFPRTRKNSSGYALDAWLASGDLLDLVIGAEGTLGVVTAVEWRLDRVPGHRVGLRIALATMDRFAEVIGILLDSRPSAVELLDRTFLSLVASRLPGDVAAAAAGAEADDPGRAGVE